AASGEDNLGLKRARFKMEGHVAKPWLTYKIEHDLVGNRLLDARFTVAKWKWLQFSAGQWKAEYSRERVDSSGKQQFAERSIVNRAFTVDRQKGVMLHGRVGEDQWWDSQYFSGVFSGNGRGFRQPALTQQSHDDGGALWVNRYQWNALGGGVGFSQSDLERTRKPALSLAVASARNRSRYTRFSSSGGGQLDGFSAGAPGQYSIRQELVEAAFKYRGFSTQNEYHWKSVRDNLSGRLTPLRGMVLQAGYFPSEAWAAIPRQLEVGVRKAFVDPNANVARDRQREIALVVNWFFEGHNDKLTFDVSRYSLVRQTGAELGDVQVRAQWELTF
ncbi:MAG: porin, partial [Acidobacteria bacterium]|nr:porin [Acidobacteriota bacterium]